MSFSQTSATNKTRAHTSRKYAIVIPSSSTFTGKISEYGY